MNLYDENTAYDFQKLFYHIVAHEMGWCGGEESACLTTYFGEEFDNQVSQLGELSTTLSFQKQHKEVMALNR